MIRLGAFERWLARVEVWLLAGCLVALCALIAMWIGFRALAFSGEAPTSGFIARALLTYAVLSIVLGVVKAKRVLHGGALVLSCVLAFIGKDVGTQWAANVFGWLQDGSTLTLFGGIRGVSTRLTLAIAFLGACHATSLGQHVSIDVLVRLLDAPFRKAVTIVSIAVGGISCLVIAWGFISYTAIDAARAPANANAAEVVSSTSALVGQHAFFVGRQLSLDLRVAPRVLWGTPWNTSLSAEEWNSWLERGDWGRWYSAEIVETLRDTSDESHRAPLLVVPADSARGILIRSANLVVPLGFLALALRLLLRAVLTVRERDETLAHQVHA